MNARASGLVLVLAAAAAAGAAGGGCSTKVELPWDGSGTPTASGTGSLPPTPIPQDTTLTGIAPVNRCWRIEDTDRGTRVIHLTPGALPGPAAGEALVLWQVQTAVAGEAGTYQAALVELVSTSGTTIDVTLHETDPLTLFAFAFKVDYTSSATRAAQACTLPFWEDVDVTGRLRPDAWNGEKGGLVAFVARGTLSFVSDGIDASGSGFRGASPTQIPVTQPQVCSTPPAAQTADPALAAARGEGTNVAGEGFGAAPAGNGGGGGCRNAGGGGGGNGGSGGLGGEMLEGDGAGGNGEGGFAVGGSLLDTLTLGGGGGAGHDWDNLLFRSSRGQPGGGAVWIIADDVQSNDFVIRANGAAGLAVNQTTLTTGLGGGGAGGSILLQVAQDPPSRLPSIEARGGKGGELHLMTQACSGPGGGGGGGRVRVPAGASVDVRGGDPGTCSTPTLAGPWGATAGATGVSE